MLAALIQSCGGDAQAIRLGESEVAPGREMQRLEAQFG